MPDENTHVHEKSPSELISKIKWGKFLKTRIRNSYCRSKITNHFAGGGQAERGSQELNFRHDTNTEDIGFWELCD